MVDALMEVPNPSSWRCLTPVSILSLLIIACCSWVCPAGRESALPCPALPCAGFPNNYPFLLVAGFPRAQVPIGLVAATKAYFTLTLLRTS